MQHLTFWVTLLGSNSLSKVFEDWLLNLLIDWPHWLYIQVNSLWEFVLLKLDAIKPKVKLVIVWRFPVFQIPPKGFASITKIIIIFYFYDPHFDDLLHLTKQRYKISFWEKILCSSVEVLTSSSCNIRETTFI